MQRVIPPIHHPTPPFQSFELYKYQITDVVRPDSTSTLERNFRRFLRLYASDEFSKLPREIRYYPLIEECYNRIFYGRAKRPESCPGPLRCELPRIEGLRCAVARRLYQHDSMNDKVKLPPCTYGWRVHNKLQWMYHVIVFVDIQ